MTSAGAASWGKVPSADGFNDRCGVAMASNGDVVFVSQFNGNVNVGGSTFASMSGSLDMYFARFQAADGAHVWSVAKGGSGNDAPYDVDVNNGSVIVTGYFGGAVTGGSISFGGNTLTSVGGEDAFVAKFDASNAAHQWSMRYGGSSSGEGGQHISTRSDGLVTVAGIFTRTVNFGGTQLTASGSEYDPYVVDIDGTTGAITSVKSVGGPSRDEAHDVASTADSMVFAGSFSTSIEVLQQTYTSMGGLDGYVVRYKR